MNKLLIACLSVILLYSCKKKVDELPPATQTGANTFGAKVNGEFWVPQGFGAIPANNILEAHQSGNDIIINARNFASSPNETEFQLLIQNVVTTGVYPMNTNIVHPSWDASYAYYVKRRFTPENEWVTSATSTGSVTITRIDTVARICSGTFQFNMLNIDGPAQPITVTDGRFDVRLQ